MNARPHVIVTSHERSGTHFLINGLMRAYQYDPAAFLNFDHQPLNINYFDPRTVGGLFVAIADKSPSSITKSHYPVAFFDGVLDDVVDKVIIVYIHRDPVDVMVSFWRIIQGWRWHEGPRVETALDFAAAEPEGRMMRYQIKQHANLLQRWADHVDGWTQAAATRRHIVVVRYDALKEHYGETMRGFEAFLGPLSGNPVRPNRYSDVISSEPPTPLAPPDRDALRDLALAEVGDTMRRLGYA